MIASDRILASLQWELGYSKQPNISPSEFYPAQVPGAVQLDIAREKQYPDYAHSFLPKIDIKRDSNTVRTMGAITAMSGDTAP